MTSAATVPKTGLKKWKQIDPGAKDELYLKTIKVMPVRPLMTNTKMTVRADYAVSACSPPPPQPVTVL